MLGFQILFQNRPTSDHLKTGHVPILDPHCIHFKPSRLLPRSPSLELGIFFWHFLFPSEPHPDILGAGQIFF